MNQNPYSSLLILALSMLGAIVIATCVLTYVKLNSGIHFTMDMEDPLILVGMVVGIVSIPAGLFTYRSMINKAKQLSSTEDKLAEARKAVLIRSALWETAVIMNLYAMYTSSSLIPLMVAGGVILLFVMFLPTPMRIKNDLEIE